jgi:hypothetical protein
VAGEGERLPAQKRALRCGAPDEHGTAKHGISRGEWEMMPAMKSITARYGGRPPSALACVPEAERSSSSVSILTPGLASDFALTQSVDLLTATLSGVRLHIDPDSRSPRGLAIDVLLPSLIMMNPGGGSWQRIIPRSCKTTSCIRRNGGWHTEAQHLKPSSALLCAMAA